MAKRAEYVEKNLAKAEHLYKKAISMNDRKPSAVKDLAGLLHQKGHTRQAIELLEANYREFTDVDDRRKYENLLKSLNRQSDPTPKSMNKTLKLAGLSINTTRSFIQSLFYDPSRI